jgi:hypothetical protein
MLDRLLCIDGGRPRGEMADLLLDGQAVAQTATAAPDTASLSLDAERQLGARPAPRRSRVSCCRELCTVYREGLRDVDIATLAA